MSAPASSPSSPDFDRRPCGLDRPAPADDQDLADAGVVDRGDRLVGGVRGCELLRRQREHAGDVERDVAVPDHDGALMRQVELELLEIGVAVVPGDELRRGPRAGQVLAGDAEATVGLSAYRIHDCVVEPAQLLVREVPPDLDVAEEAKAGLRRSLLERARDRLDVRVVGRDPAVEPAPTASAAARSGRPRSGGRSRAAPRRRRTRPARSRRRRHGEDPRARV